MENCLKVPLFMSDCVGEEEGFKRIAYRKGKADRSCLIEKMHVMLSLEEGQETSLVPPELKNKHRVRSFFSP